MAIGDKLQQVQYQFEQKGIRLDSDWLNGCVEFFVEENPAISISQLVQQALEQWELSDLSDSVIKCLPDSIFDKTETHNINGIFPLQMQFLLDISESAYDQLQRLQNKEIEVGKEKPEFKQKNQKIKKKRMLKLELTDGFRTVSALEYTLIPCLNTQLPPGLKVLVKGPIRCVNHILFLEEKNISLMGGEVTTMTIENAYENVLRKILNQPINQNPNTEYQEATVTTEANVLSKVNSIPSTPMTRSNATVQSHVISSENNFIEDFPDDDFLNDIDVDQIALEVNAISTETSRPNQDKPITTNQRSTILFDDIDDEAFLNIDSIGDQLNTMSPCENLQSEQQIFTRRDECILLPPIFSDVYRFKIRGLNLATIRQLIECSVTDRELRKYFMVKAYIRNIVGRARISNKQWTLNALITDRFSSNMVLEVSFAANVLDKLAGISGHEVHQMYAVRNQRPQIEEDLECILKKLSEALDDLNLFMKIEFESGANFPVIVELINSAPVLEHKLQEKTQCEKLI